MLRPGVNSVLMYLSQAVSCSLEVPPTLLSGGQRGKEAAAHQVSGRVLKYLWCARHDPHLARGPPEGMAAGLQTREADR